MAKKKATANRSKTAPVKAPAEAAAPATDTPAPPTRRPRAAAQPRIAATPAATQAPNHQQIAVRAFALWETEGCPHGQAQRHWAEAENALRREAGL